MPFSQGPGCQTIAACMRLHYKCMDIGLPLPNVIANDRGDNDLSIYDRQGNESGQCL